MTCRVCGRPLSDPASIRRGIGPICAERESRGDQAELFAVEDHTGTEPPMKHRPRAPYTAFRQTRLVPVHVYVDGKETDDTTWERTLWIERGEDWYAFMNDRYRGKRVRVITRTAWLNSEIITPAADASPHGGAKNGDSASPETAVDAGESADHDILGGMTCSGDGAREASAGTLPAGDPPDKNSYQGGRIGDFGP